MVYAGLHDTHHAGSRNWLREKGPAFVGGAKGIVMQRGRLGGYPAPAHIPNSGRWNWFYDGRPPAVIPGNGGNGVVPSEHAWW